MNIISFLLELAGEETGTIAAVSLAFLLIYFLTHPDKVEKWGGIISKLFSSISRRAERRAVGLEIQSEIKSYVNNYNNKNVLKYDLVFKWVHDEETSSYLKDDSVVIIMQHHTNNARNFLNALMQYTKHALLPSIRDEIPSPVMDAVELMVQENIIREKKPDILHAFKNEIVPTKTIDDSTKSVFEQLKIVNQLGWFDHIFLNEIQHVGARLHELDDERKQIELENFLKFLNDVAKRQHGSETKLDFFGSVFHINIMLVARTLNRILANVDAYVDRANLFAGTQIDSLYVASSGPNISFTNNVVSEMHRRKIGTLIWNISYKTKIQYREDYKLVLFRNLNKQR